MDDELNELVRRHQSADNQGQQFLITLTTPATTIWLRSGSMTEFLVGYCDIVSRRKGNYYLAEVPRANVQVPLVVQGAFRFTRDLEPRERHFMVHTIIARYQRAIREKLHLLGTGAEQIAVYLAHYDRTSYTHRYRVQFPYCRIDQFEVYAPLRSIVIDDIANENPWNVVPVSDWNMHIDPQPYRSLTMYHSRDGRGLESLELVNVYSELAIGARNQQDISDAEHQEHLENQWNPPLQDRPSLVVPNNHSAFRRPPTGIPSPEEDFDWWIPVLLSINYASNLNTQAKNELPTNGSAQPTLNSASRLGADRFTNFGIACELLDTCMKEKRAQTDILYLDIGKALHTITKGSQEGYRKWLDFGQQRGANVRLCPEAWPKLEGTGIGLRTLMWYAREDSPNIYQQWADAWKENDISGACGGQHALVAKALYKTFLLDYCCADPTGDSNWFQFKDHRWVRIPGAYSLRIAITETFVHEFNKHLSKAAQMQAQVGLDPSSQARCKMDIENLVKLKKQLGDHVFKNRVIAESRPYFYDEHFSDKYDNAAHLICVKNGVIEMYDGHFEHRDGKPDDYLTMSTNVRYDPTLNWQSHSVLMMLEWINQLLVVPSLVNSWQNYLGSIPYGGNLDKVVVPMTGPPNAGKSSFTQVLFMALGDYAKKGENGVLYGARTGDGPSPSLARLRGVRVVAYEELETERGTINSGFVKRATGNDSYFARFLNQNGGDITPLYKTIFVCNDIPAFSTFEEAMRDRLFPVPFDSRWIDNPPGSREEQQATRTFKKDRFFSKRLPELAKALLWLMFQWYPKYCQEGLQRTAEIAGVAKKYWANVDYYYQFVESHLLQYNLPDGRLDPAFNVDTTTAHANFAPWFRERFPSMKVPSHKSFVTGVSNHIGDVVNNKWFGYYLHNTGGGR